MFKKYCSIENTYRTQFLDKIKSHGFWNNEFIVQEKVHGANLSYWTANGIDFYAAKKTAQIQGDEKFYNYELVLNEIKPKLQNIWSTLKKEIDNLEQLTIFGEIIGGNYPHAEVEPDKNAIMVQKGILYSPQNLFYAFDIMINSDRYLDVDKTALIFEEQDLLYAKTLFQGNIEECLAYPNNFESTIPNLLNLPPIVPNIIEGVIIRPVQTSYFKSGKRVILKNKNERWSENKKFNKTIKAKEQLPEKIVKLQEAILTYVTENRLNNVISKIGEVSPKDLGKVLGLFSKDVLEDFLKDYGEITKDLEKKEMKLITKSFASTAKGMIINKLNE
ncbi:MAG: RNA ligase, Rnl2 family [Cytophagales bacterium]|nr:RNA ligase, Rnl2 family [Cytophagales bacterium]